MTAFWWWVGLTVFVWIIGSLIQGHADHMGMPADMRTSQWVIIVAAAVTAAVIVILGAGIGALFL